MISHLGVPAARTVSAIRRVTWATLRRSALLAGGDPGTFKVLTTP